MNPASKYSVILEWGIITFFFKVQLHKTDNDIADNLFQFQLEWSTFWLLTTTPLTKQVIRIEHQGKSLCRGSS